MQRWEQVLAETAGNATMQIYDATGRVVYNNMLRIPAPSGKTSISVGNLNTGVYFVSIRSESVSYSGKLAVIH